MCALTLGVKFLGDHLKRLWFLHLRLILSKKRGESFLDNLIKTHFGLFNKNLPLCGAQQNLLHRLTLCEFLIKSLVA